MVLVSHDLGNVRGLCKQVLWLEKGEIRALGPTEEVVAAYLDDVNRAGRRRAGRPRPHRDAGRLRRRALHEGPSYWTRPAADSDVFQPGEPIRIRAEYHRTFRPLERPIFRFAIRSPHHGVTIFAVDSPASACRTWWTARAWSLHLRGAAAPAGAVLGGAVDPRAGRPRPLRLAGGGRRLCGAGHGRR